MSIRPGLTWKRISKMASSNFFLSASADCFFAATHCVDWCRNPPFSFEAEYIAWREGWSDQDRPYGRSPFMDAVEEQKLDNERLSQKIKNLEAK